MSNQNLHYKNLLSNLRKSAQNSEEEIFLVAPFIKFKILSELSDEIGPDLKLTIVTRWRLDEILSGVSDIEVWELLRNRENSSLKLSPNLHAKYYRFDNSIFLGSANLTEKALVQSPSSNLELLQEGLLTEQLKAFERSILTSTIPVTDQLYDQVVQIVDQYEKKESFSGVNELGIDYKIDETSVEEVVDRDQWLPKSRNPENLFVYYSNEYDKLTADQIRHAEIDISFFSIPNSLGNNEFNEFISFQLLQVPIVRKIDAFLNVPRRFGEMSDFLYSLDKKIEPKRSWQTLMRWLIFFFPDKYSVSTLNYSEIIIKNA